MCSPLGAILYRASRRLNTVNFKNIPGPVQKILQKNGFLSYYGHAKKLDEYGTTIQYNRFERKDDRYFGSYIEKHFKNKAIPDMSPALRNFGRVSLSSLVMLSVIQRQKWAFSPVGNIFLLRNV